MNTKNETERFLWLLKRIRKLMPEAAYICLAAKTVLGLLDTLPNLEEDFKLNNRLFYDWIKETGQKLYDEKADYEIYTFGGGAWPISVPEKMKILDTKINELETQIKIERRKKKMNELGEKLIKAYENGK